MKNEYESSITKVNFVINNLPFESKEKIPQGVINFFSNYSNPELLTDDMKSKEILSASFNQDDLKFLKIIDYYINGI